MDFVDQSLVQDAHDRGLKVLVYTVDEPADQAMLAAIGVDGIFTNRPDRFLPPAKTDSLCQGSSITADLSYKFKGAPGYKSSTLADTVLAHNNKTTHRRLTLTRM